MVWGLESRVSGRGVSGLDYKVEGLGCRVEDLGPRVKDQGRRVWGIGSKGLWSESGVSGLGSRGVKGQGPTMEGLGLILGLGCRGRGLGSRGSSSLSRASGLGSRASGLGSRV
eukprot:2496444-Rhodomonas_salina.2